MAIVFGLSLSCMSAVPAFADDFSFTILDGPTSYFYGRDHLTGGMVQGTLYGLTNNAWSFPSQVSITYTEPGLGFTPGPLNNYWYFDGTGIQETNGQITNANFLFDFHDAAGNAFQIRLNDQVEVPGANWLFWNGGATPIVGVGNTLGFDGAQYSNLAVAPGPIPGTGLLSFAVLALAGALTRARGFLSI